MLFFKLAWKNLFRNKRRTLLTALAIGIGVASLMLTDALMIGMMENMIRSATATYLGEGQIHRNGFRKTFEVEKTIVNHENIIENLRKEKDLTDFAPRTVSYAMITSPSNVDSVMLSGIDPVHEKNLSKIDEAVIKGSYLDTKDDSKILIGKKLAEILEVEVGDKIVLTVAQAETGELSQEMFRVGGIFRFGIREMDRGMAFIQLEKSQKLLGLGNKIHEIALKFSDIKLTMEPLPFFGRYSKDDNEALSWTQLLSELSSIIELSQFSVWIFAVILFLVVAAGVVNSLFMSLYERMFEFGVLRAVGTRPFQMALLIIFEACALSIVSIVIGSIIGTVVNLILIYTGIDYTGTEFVGVTFGVIYPVFHIKQYIIYPFVLFVFTILVGIYPAIHAAKITPSKAMKKGL